MRSPRCASLGKSAHATDLEEIRRSPKRTAKKGVSDPYTFYTYPDFGHWFFEQDYPASYTSQAKRVAWERTVEFLRGQLGRSQSGSR